jgi:D-alanine-D-alanine ligase-like ATP-grasp enzyme
LYIMAKKITFELAFVVIHGTPGEDGKIASLF